MNANAARTLVRSYLNRRAQFGRNTLENLLTRSLPARQTTEIVPGLRLALDLAKSNQRTLFWFHELAEPSLQWTIRNLLPLGGTMVDCGANAGLMSCSRCTTVRPACSSSRRIRGCRKRSRPISS